MELIKLWIKHHQWQSKVIIGLVISGLIILVVFLQREVSPLTTSFTNQNASACYHPFDNKNECWSCPNSPNYIEADFYPVLSYIAAKAQSVGNKSDYQRAEYQLMVDYANKCVNIRYDKEKKFLGKAEGVFFYQNGNVYISPDYNALEDMLGSSILLVHELTHAITDASPNSRYKSCVDSEVGAYLSQYYFVVLLPEKERQYVVNRLHKDALGYEKASSVTTLRVIMEKLFNFELSKEPSVRIKQQEDIIKDYVITNPAYRKQCRLD